MNKLTVYHAAKSNYSFAVSNNTLRLRLRTASDDFNEVYAVYGVKYGWHNKKEKLMNKILTDSEFDYYEVDITEETKRFAYYFKLCAKDNSYYFTENGVQIETDENLIKEYYFQFPYINEIDRHITPDWIKSAACYQIFPDRFNNGNPELNPYNVKAWGTKPTPWNFMGGDLPGITKKLDYIKELGINVVYMTPFFKSNSNHKYDTIDYYEIDPHFGTKDDFKNLVNKAHALGMRVMLDAVFNHSAIEFFAFQDVLRNEENSKYKDWFHINKFPINLDRIMKASKNSKKADWYIQNGENILTYECFGYYPGMPKLNTANPELKQYLLNAGKYWITEFDIDGWRLDVANEVDHSFWRDFRNIVKSSKPEALIIGEIWNDGEPWLRGDQFDGIMNYGFTNAVKDLIAFKTIDTEIFKQRINQLLMRNTDTASQAMLNLLDSHDTERILTSVDDSKEKLIMCLAFIYTFPGIPMIYYGTEIGITGSNDPGCRKCMQWNEKKWNKEILASVKKLINIYKSELTLQSGNFSWADVCNKEVIAFRRNGINNTILIVANNTKDVEKIKLPELFKDAKLLFGNNEYCSMHPYEIKIVKV